MRGLIPNVYEVDVCVSSHSANVLLRLGYELISNEEGFFFLRLPRPPKLRRKIPEVLSLKDDVVKDMSRKQHMIPTIKRVIKRFNRQLRSR